MFRFSAIALVLYSFATIVNANDCRYWTAKVDPKAKLASHEINENDPKNIINGIECLLQLQGTKRVGVLYGSREYTSQFVPKASVEINALYEITRLFYGNYNFASAVALVSEGEEVKFNKGRDIKRAFESYRNWFQKVKEIGIQKAREQRLDPLEGSGVRWY